MKTARTSHCPTYLPCSFLTLSLRLYPSLYPPFPVGLRWVFICQFSLQMSTRNGSAFSCLPVNAEAMPVEVEGGNETDPGLAIRSCCKIILYAVLYLSTWLSVCMTVGPSGEFWFTYHLILSSTSNTVHFIFTNEEPSQHLISSWINIWSFTKCVELYNFLLSFAVSIDSTTKLSAEN